MKRLQPMSSPVKRTKSFNQHGLTLIELIVAMTLVPILILSAGVMYLNVSKVSAATAMRGNALAERTLIQSTLPRIMANASTAAASVPCAADGCDGGACNWCYSIELTTPAATQQIFRLKELLNSTDVVLEFSDNGGPWDQISYYGSITCGDPATGGCAGLPANEYPFRYDEIAGVVTVDVGFKTGDQHHPYTRAIQLIKLEGGQGVA